MVGVALGAAAIGAAGSLAGAGMGMASSKSANAANQKMMQQLWAIAQQQNAPYQKFGKAGMNMYQQMLPQLLAQQQYQQFTPEMYKESPLYTPMVNNLAELKATPGYQFQLQQGEQQLGQTAAATGGLLSGAQQKAANNYAQNQASTGFQAAWQRAQTAYQNAFNTYNQQYANQLAGANAQSNMLGDITKIGYGAANAPTTQAAGVAPYAMSSNTANAQTQGEGYGAMGTAANQLTGNVYNTGVNNGWWGNSGPSQLPVGMMPMFGQNPSSGLSGM